jgi:tetratricopeptide (TPR) repeat protein
MIPMTPSRLARGFLLVSWLAGWTAHGASGPPDLPDIAPLQRMRFARLLIPADPDQRIQARFPRSRLLGEAELANIYAEMRREAHLGVTTWVDLMVNFALRGRYAEARDCLSQAVKREDFSTEAGLFDAWFIERQGNHRAALAAYEELIALQPSEIILLQRRAGCLLALYRPQAAGQALTGLEALPSVSASWVEHLRGLISLVENDLDQAQVHFVQAWRLGGRRPLPESAAGLALVHRAHGAQEEAIGWLNFALQTPDERLRLTLVNHPIWRPLWDNPVFQEAAVRHRWPFDPARVEEAVLAEALAEAGVRDVDRSQLPEDYLAPLKLKEHEPGTRVRTLTGKLNLEAVEKR